MRIEEKCSKFCWSRSGCETSICYNDTLTNIVLLHDGIKRLVIPHRPRENFKDHRPMPLS